MAVSYRRWHHSSARRPWKHPTSTKIDVLFFSPRGWWLLVVVPQTQMSSCSPLKHPALLLQTRWETSTKLNSESRENLLFSHFLSLICIMSQIQAATESCDFCSSVKLNEADRGMKKRSMFPLCSRCDHTLWHWQQLPSHCLLHLLIVWFCLWTLPLLSWLTGGESWFPFEVHDKRKRLRQSGAAKKSPEGQSLWKLSAAPAVK